MSNAGNQKTVQKFFTPLERAFQEEQERINERQKELDKQHGEETEGSDRKLDKQQQHDYAGEEAAKKKNFDQKIYMFPESFNALRRELYEHWPMLFMQVNPETGTSLAHDMANDAAQFVGTMNGALGLNMQFDSDNVDTICKVFLDELRVLRGLSRLH
jgi:hypothetical protein